MSFTRKIDNQFVNISVIIAAKNEEKNIDSLLSSIKKQDYPGNLFEVIIVDDNSSDGTLKQLMRYADEMENLTVKNLNQTGQNGKRDALSYGIESAQHPFLLITDADCCPEPGWLRAHSKAFIKGYDVQFGIAPFEQNNTFINKIGCFENLRSSILSFTFARLGLPYSAAARNMGFTKQTFNLLGGYSQTKETLSGDDDLLLREAVKRKLKVGIVTEEGSFVFSEAKKNFKDYLIQKARHTQTSIHYLFKHKILLGIWHLLNLFLLFSVILITLNLFWGVLFISKMSVDTLIVKLCEKKYGYRFNLFEIILLQITYELLLIVHFFNARFMKIKWK